MESREIIAVFIE